jgi:hypothetical protein
LIQENTIPLTTSSTAPKYTPMKLINYTITIAIILLIISCGQPQEEKSVDTNQSNPTETLIDLKETVRAGNASPLEVQEKWDSLNNSKILTKAIRMAEKLKGLNIFKRSTLFLHPIVRIK